MQDTNAAFAISAAGMALERARVETAVLNLSNAHAAGSGYQPLRVIAEPATRGFAEMLEAAGSAAALAPAFSVTPASTAPRQVHEPGHPLADARGFVSYPAVDTATEMVTLMSATRAYEANVAAMNAARTLAQKALEIGGNA